MLHRLDSREEPSLEGASARDPMKIKTYSRWDESQAEFELEPESVLDALSDLLMEGLDVREALEWMRRQGFALAGLDLRVMGTDEMLRDLTRQIDAIFDRYDMSSATVDLARRLEDLLDREQHAVQDTHGFESARLNDFLERRTAPDERLSDAIERFRDYRFEDEEAGADFADLLAESERLRRLEDFVRSHGDRFRGDEAVDYETAQALRERFERITQLARDLADGNFESVSAEQLRDLLGDSAAQSILLLQRLEPDLRRAGLLRGDDDPALTPRAIRRIGAQALAEVYAALRKGRAGGHPVRERGISDPRPDATKAFEFGDPLDLDVVRTMLRAIARRAADPGNRVGQVAGREPVASAGRVAAHALAPPVVPAGPPVHGTAAAPARGLQLSVDDFVVREFDYSVQSTTVLLLDMSWSMSWAGRFAAAKRVAIAMDHLIRTRFPRDHFFVVGFSTRAREVAAHELPEISWDMGEPFTNLQEGLMLAEQLIAKHPSSSPQILVITDGQPTAYFRGRELHVEWPLGFGGISPNAVAETMKTVHRVTRRGITINTFMLDDAPELLGFVERVTEVNRGRAFYTEPGRLGSFLMVDYLNGRRKRRT
jgi:uncharacterized protein with von Willebrand factor type A (vWA) domain